MDDTYKILVEAFKSETVELLQELETALLELEDSPEDGDLVDRVFRALHTIKGNGSMFGFDSISDFTHDIETIYDRVREGKTAVSSDLINLTLSSRDVIYDMLEDPSGDDPTVAKDAAVLLHALRSYLPGTVSDKKGKGPLSAEADRVQPVQQMDLKTYRICFRPDRNLFHTGTNPVTLLDELGSMGDHTVIPNLHDLPPLDRCDPEACYLAWDIFLTTDQDMDAIRDVFIFVQDLCELRIDVIDETGFTDSDEKVQQIGQILVDRGELSREALETILKERIPIGEELVGRELINRESIESALVEQQIVREAKVKRRESESAANIRVTSEKLDSMMDLVGELVTVQARLSETSAQKGDPDFEAISERVEMLTWELRDNALSIRMIPIGTTFNTFRRLVRDLSIEMGREVNLVTEGGQTELDKTVIEKLKDPLVHLIRNSIDHGIEPPGKREREGKPREGTIILSASQSGADVVIRISDDGAGLDEETIRAKALQKGLISSDSDLSTQDLFSMIFAPAFSTASEVTSVSGRGVGMDVVKRAVDALRGSIEIDSMKGVGTDIIVRLPLTLAIIEGLQVDIAGDRFIFPLSEVEECVELDMRDVSGENGLQLTSVRGKLVPYIRLREWFFMNGEQPDSEKIVIAGMNGNRVGFVVDHVIGEQQTVIKSLGKVFKNIEGISGATILGDGTVALIVDVPRIIRVVEG